MATVHSTTRLLRFAGLRRRGSIYLTVLAAASLVSLIGVGALAAARVQSRAAVHTNDATRAAAMAQSATELARLRIAGDANWRTSYTHDVWVSDIAFADGTITFKLVDETDANLADNGSQPVRLFGKGLFGKATRLVSVELKPDLTGKMVPTTGTWRQEILP